MEKTLKTFIMFARPEKIRVEVLSQKGMKARKCVVESDRIIIKKGKGVKGDPSITAKFEKDCIIPYRAGMWPFKTWKQKLVWIEGHDRCVMFYGKKTDLGVNDIKGFFEAGAIKNAGSTLQKLQIPMALYLIIGAVLVLQVVQLLMARGNLRL